jgi:hypothetical protein
MLSTYKIEGTFLETGQYTELVINAKNGDEAEAIACTKGIRVSRIVPVPYMSMTALVTDKSIEDAIMNSLHDLTLNKAQVFVDTLLRADFPEDKLYLITNIIQSRKNIPISEIANYLDLLDSSCDKVTIFAKRLRTSGLQKYDLRYLVEIVFLLYGNISLFEMEGYFEGLFDRKIKVLKEKAEFPLAWDCFRLKRNKISKNKLDIIESIVELRDDLSLNDAVTFADLLFELDHNGYTHSYKFDLFKGIIQSHRNMTPNEVVEYANNLPEMKVNTLKQNGEFGMLWESTKKLLQIQMVPANFIDIIRTEVQTHDELSFRNAMASSAKSLSRENHFSAKFSCLPQEIQEGFLSSIRPESCGTCGEYEWKLVSLSPNVKSVTWKCEYCGRTLLNRIDELCNKKNNGDRQPIPKAVQREVWQRDQGKCIECGSREKLEYDHRIPVSEGGSNTARNIQLLCESCNRKKAGNEPGNY